MFQIIYIVVFVIHLCSSQEVTQRDPRALQEELSSLKKSMEDFMDHWTDFSLIENYNNDLENKYYTVPALRDIQYDKDSNAVGKIENQDAVAETNAPVNIQEEKAASLGEAGSSSGDNVGEGTSPDIVEDDANTQSTVSIGDPVIVQEKEASDAVPAEIPKKTGEGDSEGPVSFEGPVHAQGKVSVGAHYGPYCIPPFYPDPWMYMPPCMPSPYMMYPFPMPDYYYMPEYVTGKDSDAKGHLPVASILAKHYCDSTQDSGEAEQGNVVFNGIVPSGGTVSIAARY